jgi:hypothetical protein
VKGVAWLTDDDGDQVLCGVGCSERGEVRGCQDVRASAPSSSEWGGVGVVMHIFLEFKGRALVLLKRQKTIQLQPKLQQCHTMTLTCFARKIT